MPLIKELIQIPERIHQGDFVLKLSEGVSQAEATLRHYVVTPQLARAFDDALGFVKGAVDSGQSKAAYLHGSFGAGKSHFMAVLHLLLQGNLQARALPELAEPVARHEWIRGRKFLMVPYHMVGAVDMESAVLGRYAEYVRKLHPEAPIPGFYQAEGLFRDARQLRAQVGDDAFFSRLNQSASTESGGGWGNWSEWDAHAFESAMLEPPAGNERVRLVGHLINAWFTAYRGRAGASESFVSFDEGLAIMSAHAADLGYNGVILFLDELVLWLASHAADVNFVSREGTKLVKLVEATDLQRPIPLISFIARQRDLRELVGDSLPGASGVQFTDVLRHWEARFHKITLEDRNLPAIAQKRVLRPVSEAARSQIEQAFEETLRMRRDLLETLLTSEADRELFSKVYPFSPALVQALIAVSAALQRERTALKLMMQLLVDRRNDLELGQLIPVGDLWDVIAEGDEPFSDAMRVHFDNARRLYSQKLLPMLEQRHGITWEAVRLGQVDAAAAKGLRNDARLLKTLLLAALVPEVESLKALTAQRLTALNHGTFRSPIPGQEAQMVLRKLRDWVGEIGEIKVGEDQNPVVSIQITGVDLEPILRAADTNDNEGNRRKLVRDLLFGQLGLSDGASLFTQHRFDWRGTPREVDVVYENVRLLADDRLKGHADTWTVLFDYPFDDAHRTPLDDIARLNDYRGGRTRSVVWLPSFLSPRAQQDLGRLVILDHILQGDRFEQYTAHLSLIDRTQARALAGNQRDSLRAKLKTQLEVAYGITPEPRDAVSHTLEPDQHLRSLDPTFSPRPPVGADLGSAFADLLDQMHAHQYAPPGHASYAELVAWQADEGAFVDWARFRLLGGDEHPSLSAAYSRLRQAVATRRQALNRRFATALTEVNRENRWQQGRAMPLERVLEDLVAPLMTGSNVLLLVMDGLSLSIFRELLARPELIGWKELVAEELGQPLTGIAALPSMTEVSRASLLCGALRIGSAAQEKPAFAAHPALLQRSGKKPPVLFHKAEILDDTGLAAPLREAIVDSNRRLVGVVYNAVDDHLGGPEQLHQSWNIEQLRGLMPLLHAARDARRTLVLTADHGHVLEESSRTIAGGDSDRWRPVAGKAPAEGEIRFEGGRVLSPAGEAGVVCLIDEGLRYTGRKNGYHGGASLQEVCVPLSVFAPLGLGIEGWIDAPPAASEWWDLPLMPEPARPVERPRPARKPARGNDQQASLFGSLPVPEPGATAAPTTVWIDALLVSGTYLAQKQLAARVALDDKQMRTLLDALDARGGKLGWNALAQRLKVPELRLGGLLSAARRVLNVDQSPVLAWDEQSRTVELNRALLEQQFGISGKVRR